MASTNVDVQPGETSFSKVEKEQQDRLGVGEPAAAECSLPSQTAATSSSAETSSMGRMKSSPQSSSNQKTSKKVKEPPESASSGTNDLPLMPMSTGTKNVRQKQQQQQGSPVHHIVASSGGGTSPPPASGTTERTPVRRTSSGTNAQPSNNSRTNNAGTAATASGAKPSCFCWCCCYRCTCISSRNQEEEQSKSKDFTSKDSWSNDPDVTPSIEEIRCWGDSFDRLMRSTMGRAVFREFLKCEYSEENILFWLACEDLKKDNSPEVVEEKARLIYEDYISILSPKEVSLDSRVREIVNRNMVDPTPHTFDEAQLQIYTLMHRDSYPRFVNSSYYKKLAQLSNTSRKESSA